ncbi:MAG: hypothetical protein WCF44_16480 [Candidatus Methylophosphatis roskildensis]
MKPEPIPNPHETCRTMSGTSNLDCMTDCSRHSGGLFHVRFDGRCCIALIAALCLSACASFWPRGNYARWVLDRPLPANEAQWREECTWIRDEIGRQHDFANERATFAEGREAVMIRVTLEEHLMVLESRAKAARCNE